MSTPANIATLAGGAILAALGITAWWRASRQKLLDQLEIEREKAILEERQRQFEVERASIQERLTALKQQEDAALLQTRELERISAMTQEQAKEELLQSVRSEAAQESETFFQDAEREAKRRLITIMERMSAQTVAEGASTLVPLPSEDMKGRLIGKEGRNIRAFEQITGVDLIIDDTPEAVTLSSFDPIRRETARMTLLNLILDGRIHPQRIEELFQKAQTEMERNSRDAGWKAAEDAGVHNLPEPVIEVLGKLRFRTAYAQNVLEHSVETAHLSALIAEETSADVAAARKAGLLHDIGKALGPEWEGPHALAGMEFLKRHEKDERVLNAVGAHHHEIEPLFAESFCVITADTISATRPGARRDSLETYVKRLEELEAIAVQHTGVDRAFAIQAGREVRVLVKPDQVNDDQARDLARRIARQIKQSSAFSGTIKVTVIRETRATETTS